MKIDYRRLLTSFLVKHDINLLSEVDTMLKKYRGKEPKLMLILAKKYDTSNPLNRIFLSCVTEEHLKDYVALTTLFLSIFYPQHTQEAAKLCLRNQGNEEKLFKKLSSNFLAINPLKMDRTTCNTSEEMMFSKPIDYNTVLTEFYMKHDAEKVEEVDDILTKCIGKEAILFSVLALKYSTTNALNAVFEERMKDVAEEVKDHLSLLQLYLSVFHPSCAPEAKSMLLKYKGKEEELFSRLASKFQAYNALKMWNDDDFGKESKKEEELDETVTTNTAKETTSRSGDDATPSLSNSPPVGVRRSARLHHSVAQSPAVTP
jgi:hypothetical protein